MAMPEIRVLVVDDHAILREGIRSLLENQPNVCIVGEAADGQEALEKVAITQPDLVLMDIAMPQMDGLEATKRIKAAYPEVQILVLSQHDNREFILPLLEAGAAGYVLKRSGSRELLAAIRGVMEEGAYLQPAVARQLIDHHVRRRVSEAQAPQLTGRETEVLQLVVAGRTSREIGLQLNISAKTVSVHRSNLMAKLGVHSSAELISYAIHHGLIKP
jgi:DNA-binding NarL/FixJ family response regulator